MKIIPTWGRTCGWSEQAGRSWEQGNSLPRAAEGEAVVEGVVQSR